MIIPFENGNFRMIVMRSTFVSPAFKEIGESYQRFSDFGNIQKVDDRDCR
jgi:hypothetical protein